MSSRGLRRLEHPLRSGTTANLVISCVTIIVADKQQLVAKTNNKLTGLALNGSSSLIAIRLSLTLSSNCLQERVNEWRDQSFWGVAKEFAGHAPETYLLRAKLNFSLARASCAWRRSIYTAYRPTYMQLRGHNVDMASMT